MVSAGLPSSSHAEPAAIQRVAPTPPVEGANSRNASKKDNISELSKT